ncbi:oxidoreductase [Legionella sp. km772]|uniref:oxidoreductase n=1 Tax=Legionella sp. km772 TaxID=2498111 RepID=UPI000F8C4BB0|nr:oxidoreductase [Legionella sp. km772]RUR12112.1 SDR family oxidoreductase [Legionella sp. km772]
MLNNKKILVLGAGGLLGSALTKTLLEQKAEVIAADINYPSMISRLIKQGVEENCSGLNCLELDITNSAQVIDYFTELRQLDGVVNCSYPRNKNYGRQFLEVSLNDFNENLALHLGSAFLLIQQCAGFFLRTKRPFSLVNIASVYGVIPPRFSVYEDTAMTMPVEYAAIKSALIHLNKYAVSFVNNSDFRVNSVSPGGIFDNQPEPFLEKYKKQTLGRGMLQVQDVLGAILFLLSEYSHYMNGQNLIVDDGFSL